MVVTRMLRIIAGSVGLFMVALVTSTAAIAGIGGISPGHLAVSENDIVTQLQEGSMTVEEAAVAVRASGLDLAIN